MTRHYFDASALVKRFKPERGQQTVTTILGEATNEFHQVHSTYWAKAEFTVAMKRSRVPLHLCTSNLIVLSKLVRFCPLTTEMIDDALRYIYEFSLHAADAVHIATCLNITCDTFVTDDQHLTRPTIRKHLDQHAVQLIDLAKVP